MTPRFLLAALAALVLASSVSAQSVQPGNPLVLTDPHEGVRIPASQAEDLTIEHVYVHLLNPTGDPGRDAQLVSEVLADPREGRRRRREGVIERRPRGAGREPRSRVR